MTRRRLASALLLGLAAVLTVSGCGARDHAAAGQVTTAMPQKAVCRNLTAADIGAPTNDTPPIDCADPHNAQSYATGELPETFADAAYDDASLADWAYDQCTTGLERYLGADQSLVMRSIFTWVWFRPSQDAWDAGARWYRCDLIGGRAPSYVDLPTHTKGLLTGHDVDDQWMVCAKGATFDGASRLPCSQAHDWRAVTTIKVGEPADAYPGDAAVQAKSQQYCSDSVSAYLDYPADFDYAYTWFGADEWQAGNRRSVCWAKTTS